jgi:hypothetical protein
LHFFCFPLLSFHPTCFLNQDLVFKIFPVFLGQFRRCSQTGSFVPQSNTLKLPTALKDNTVEPWTPLPGGYLWMLISIQYDLCNKDTSQLRIAFVSPTVIIYVKWKFVQYKKHRKIKFLGFEIQWKFACIISIGQLHTIKNL